MNANIVYSIVKALSPEEQYKLYTILQKDVLATTKRCKPKKPKLITRAEADAYILKHCFGKKRSKS